MSSPPASSTCPTCRRPLTRFLEFPRVRILAVRFPPLPQRRIAGNPSEMFHEERDPECSVRSLRQAVGAEAAMEIDRLFVQAESPCPRVYYGGFEYSRGGPEGRWVYHRSRDLAGEIAEVVSLPAVRRLLARLRRSVGRELRPSRLLAGFRRDPRFRGAMRVPGRDSWRLSLDDASRRLRRGRRVRFCLLTDGPNMGSAGGPTLMVAGELAAIEYEGILV